MSTIKEQIKQDTVAAMKSGDKPKLATLRLINAALKQKEVDERIELDDKAVLGILNKMIKQRRDSISQYETAKRQDLIDQEAYEIGIIEQYMPAQLSDEAIRQAVSETLTTLNITSVKDMGKAMAQLKETLAGKADMSKVSQILKEKLT